MRGEIAKIATLIPISFSCMGTTIQVRTTSADWSTAAGRAAAHGFRSNG